MPIRYRANALASLELLMPEPPSCTVKHRSEAERLIELARVLLDRPEEEMVVNYLDHAIEALNMIEPDSRSA